ncbi:MAG: hypothetical protein UU05_C0002G0036 [Candidatus Curtissbacteria bacterium GW2011_GWA1_40_47]|uniref:Glycosyltransferase RgtA/B/C/D-like domain-containing protein n=1 Tax=Candidatus Curtissbacteria bacterium RIFOXYA1_FULL_41_14 TaxID=1797737 RepID=A0A1F5HAZ6_9BACT|nr:MAG: hypothetical protein UT95_C0001G0037 [Candidatus Curtissbacteria bacterium GW2011_GWB1_40_28]KKR62323.1 MAG: hypothetical protein UU00_C0001G0043 [Microgenomates group bacterium GW2011_GWC1_40_35]KKR66325.1 MAG: hypothetical protein UU05_C0002G0036 [Candidatus Curtissbacteria bacterium GW2011_GWA1_40_47]KKR77864.1 MAG: hypothetical protein UU19_C0001G0010 [Candidatus Curtissbacteria bacterium GW2011_GWD1_40_8]KKS02491.1 MAG: hypothetical protein UU53_C0001G0036 [Candidatus Curtissbacter
MGKINLSYLAPLTVFIFAVFSGFIIHQATWFNVDKHFSLLAESFLHNDLFLSPNNLPNGDFVDFFGKQYLFFGPIPSILLMPFVFIWGKNFPQITLSITSLVIVYLSIFLLCRKLQFTKIDAFWLANFFVFGTVLYFVGLVNISAYVVQTIGTAFVVLALLEYFTKRRWFVIGLLIAAAGATRITLFGMTVFFLFEIIRLRQKLHLGRSFIFLLIPIFFSVSMLGLYNFRRFHSVSDTGYTRNVTVLDKNYLNNQEGFFSLKHIPANLYVLLLMPPEPVLKDGVQFVLKFPYLKVNHLGMAILFTSPLFLYLLKARKAPYTMPAIIGIIVLLIPSLVYFGIGISQFGYRYSLDFLPLLFLLLATSFKNGLPVFAKILITFGIIFDVFYMSNIWGTYPLLSFFDYLR